MYMIHLVVLMRSLKVREIINCALFVLASGQKYMYMYNKTHIHEYPQGVHAPREKVNIESVPVCNLCPI